MTSTGTQHALAHAFDDERGRLIAIAYRMLGSRTDAEDAVQEAWLRLSRQEPGSVDNLGGWLTTVVSRVCIDVLRTRKSRSETSYDEGFSDLVVTEDADSGPEDAAVMADSVGLALMMVLENLQPSERLALVLHDVFAVTYAEIGEILGTSSDAAKQLAWRARRKVQASPQQDSDRRRQREVVDAFIVAVSAGDFEGLLRVLHPDVTWRTESPRGTIVKRGAEEVAARIRRSGRARGSARRVLVNGEPGLAAWGPDGRLRGVMVCRVVGDRIVEMESVTDPERLRSVDLPATAG